MTGVPWRRRRTTMEPAPATVPVVAWLLQEGAELPDGHRIIQVSRDAAARTVRVLTSERVASELPADAPVPVVRPRARQGRPRT